MQHYHDNHSALPRTEATPTLKIHRAALANNLDAFKRLAPKSKILLPVKANAYGCGLGTLMPFFQSSSVDMLGVANVYEGVELRKLGWKKPILNLGGFFAQTLPLFVEHGITPAVTDLWHVEALQNLSHPSIEVHIKLDLGMGRIGIQKQEINNLLERLKSAPSIKVKGIFTHFPHTGEKANTHTPQQNKIFIHEAQKIITCLNLIRQDILLHAANSYSTVFFPETHHDMIRPGILFYGYYQSEADRLEFKERFPFKPCIELVATPISYRQIPRGAGISYSSLYTVEDAIENAAVLPLGYADGFPRALSNNIMFGEHPLRGRVTMDQIIVGNVTEKKTIRLLGEGVPSLEAWGD
ncbi:MAG TPA: alanine racemase, partial [Turneriella sp.]|nr:alanine racemase [Turneriella sp.]